MEPNADPPYTKNLTFLVKYLRTKNGVMFRLSNQSFQVIAIYKLNLFDHTKLILEQNGTIVTFITKSRLMTTKTLKNWVLTENQDVLERLKYFKDLIKQMLIKRSSK